MPNCVTSFFMSSAGGFFAGLNIVSQRELAQNAQQEVWMRHIVAPATLALFYWIIEHHGRGDRDRNGVPMGVGFFLGVGLGFCTGGVILDISNQLECRATI